MESPQVIFSEMDSHQGIDQHRDAHHHISAERFILAGMDLIAGRGQDTKAELACQADYPWLLSMDYIIGMPSSMAVSS